MGKRLASAGVLALFLALLFVVNVRAEPYRASTGTITRLVAKDAPDQGDKVVVYSTVRADDRINNSNLYYEIVAPDGFTIVATHTTLMPRMNRGDTFDDSWSTSNRSFPSIGTYTVTLCWSTGKAQNCDIARARTTFYSVPSLGWGLSMVGILLLAVFLWSRRADFNGVAPVFEEARGHEH